MKLILSILLITMLLAQSKADSVFDQAVDAMSAVASVGVYTTLVESQKALIQEQFKKREADLLLAYAKASKEYRMATEKIAIDTLQSEINTYTKLKQKLDENQAFYFDLAQASRDLLVKNGVAVQTLSSLEVLSKASAEVTQIEIDKTVGEDVKVTELESFCQNGNTTACISLELVKANHQTDVAMTNLLKAQSNENLEKISETSVYQLQQFTFLQASYVSRLHYLEINLHTHQVILEKLQ